MELKGTRTEQNLKNTFAGESQARNKYIYFAEAARREGYEKIAAVGGENYEWTSMYKQFEAEAREEGLAEIADFFAAVAAAEEAHEKRYLDLLAELQEGKIFKRDEEMPWKCLLCCSFTGSASCLSCLPGWTAFLREKRSLLC
ncbi:MAG: Rubrerythrin [Syntrophomonadaceae bacterium]|nr:Rubrerythrin [Bacillota bacterium]